MKSYDPLTYLWEGSNQGKGYLYYAKPMVVNVHTKCWYVQALEKLQTSNLKNHWIQLWIITW